jgi:hypothetical protein
MNCSQIVIDEPEAHRVTFDRCIVSGSLRGVKGKGPNNLLLAHNLITHHATTNNGLRPLPPGIDYQIVKTPPDIRQGLSSF